MWNAYTDSVEECPGCSEILTYSMKDYFLMNSGRPSFVKEILPCIDISKPQETQHKTGRKTCRQKEYTYGIVEPRSTCSLQ